MLFQLGLPRIKNTALASAFIDRYGVVGYKLNSLGMMPNAKKTHLECQGWFEDRARGVNFCTDAAAEKARRRKIAGSRKQVLLLKPKFSMCGQQKMFVPGVKFEFLFRQRHTATFLNDANAAVVGSKIRIHIAELKV